MKSALAWGRGRVGFARVPGIGRCDGNLPNLLHAIFAVIELDFLLEPAERDALTGCCESLGLFRSTPCGRRGSYDGGLVVVVVHWRFRVCRSDTEKKRTSISFQCPPARGTGQRAVVRGPVGRDRMCGWM